ncbi:MULTISPECIES: methyltransferase [unclassified Mycobacterium]|uniref:methyltransferase n=1 Tax=unclassified Mycobacterium TaxID=2642494 RepID=UPI000899A740|nr:Methyltransferase domain-containing protein [Mycobacterium sp. 283mftsu]
MIPSIDRYYTPPWLADYVAGLLPAETASVVDLAAGGGALLTAAVDRFEGLVVSAVDIDLAAVRLLRSSNPAWLVSHANSLSEASYRLSLAYRSRRNGYDAVLLNPPFSFRGQARERVSYRGVEYRVTPATSFVLRALEWIHSDGLVVAIIPNNVMNIEGDRELWCAWQSRFKLEKKRVLGRNTFPGAHTTAMVVTLRPGRDSGRASSRKKKNGPNAKVFTGACACVDIVRGRVPVHRAHDLRATDGVPFVHTTMLQDGMVRPTELLLPSSLESVGPFVLIPRVGKPLRAKVVSSSIERLVLSDCVFGLRAIDAQTHNALFAVLANEFDQLASLYTGSCAPYITVDRLEHWLERRGFIAEQRPASGDPGLCQCRRSTAAPA